MDYSEAESHDRVEHVGPGVVAVTANNPGPLTLDGTRTWVIGTGRVAVIDPGPDEIGHLDRVDAVISERPVSAVCLTHSHIDHSAAATAAAQRWGSLHASADTLTRLGLEGTALADGDTVSLGEGTGGPEELRVLSTPGHCGDHLAYLLLPSRDVLTGDLVLGRGSSMVAHPDGSVGAYLASLARLVSLRPARLLPGHGPVVLDAEAKLGQYARHRRARTNHVQTAIRAGASTVDEMMKAVYGDLPAGVRRAAELSLLAHVQHLEELGYETPGGIEGLSEGTTDRR